MNKPASNGAGERGQGWPLVVLAIGLLVRIQIAATTGMLHADEGMHLDTAHFSPTSEMLGQVRVTHPHPPLYFLLLHAAFRLSESLLFHRAINICIITISAWFFYAWLRRLLDRHGALLGLALYFWSPALVVTSIQVRGYSLMLAGTCGALYFLSRLLAARRGRDLAATLGCLAIAALSHYSASFFVAFLSVFTLIVALQDRHRSTALRSWMAGNALFIGIYGGLWQWHHVAIASEVAHSAATYLARGLYAPDQETLPSYLARTNISLLCFFFGRSAVGVSVLLPSLIAWLIGELRRRSALAEEQWKPATLLVALPWGLSLLAGVLHFYPHHGTRHSILLLPFLVAAVTFGTASIAQRWPKLGSAVWTLMVIWAFSGVPWMKGGTLQDDGFAIRRLASYEQQHIHGVIGWLSSRYQRGDLVWLSTGSNFYFRYYAGTNDADRWPRYPFFHLGSHRVGRFDTWVEPAWSYQRPRWSDELLERWRPLLAQGHSVWVVSFVDSLPTSVPSGFEMESESFDLFRVVRLRQSGPVMKKMP